jgi:Sphingosine kinase and enzymes related to eukaryotic diacylglycerol kinase
MTGHEAGWLETTIQDPGTGQAIEAISNDPLVVLAAGGDGTVRAVAAGMAHSKYPMGILPVGTGNLLARNLGLPFTLETALEIAVLGQDCDIDLAWLHAERVVVPSDLPAEGGLLRAANASSIRKLPEGVLEPRPDEYAYLVVAGIGFDGETMANTSAEMKKKVGWSAYILSGIKSLTSERMKATVTVYYPPGKTGPKQPNKKFSPIPKKTSESIRASKTIGHSDSPSQVVHTEENWQMSVLRARTVMLANVGDVLFLRLAPDAAIDDGMLDVVAVDTKGGIAGWISVAAKIVSQGIGLPVGNSKHGLGNIAFKQTNRARIDVNRAYPVQVDGDPVGTARTVVARTDPGALTMRIPSKTF